MTLFVAFPYRQGSLGKVPHIIPLFFLWRSAHIHQFHYFRPRISPQWHRKLKWLWTHIPWQVACELISTMGSHIVPRQQSKPTPFMCYCDNSGAEHNTEITVSSEISLWRKNSPAAFVRNQTCNFLIISLALYKWAVFLPTITVCVLTSSSCLGFLVFGISFCHSLDVDFADGFMFNDWLGVVTTDHAARSFLNAARCLPRFIDVLCRELSKLR